MGDYLKNHPHYIQGVEAERERIIALLEARLDYHWEVGIIDNDTDDIYDLDDIIALIKGENE